MHILTPMYIYLHLHINIHSGNILICLPVPLGSILALLSAMLGDEFATVCNANLKLLAN